MRNRMTAEELVIQIRAEYTDARRVNYRWDMPTQKEAVAIVKARDKATLEAAAERIDRMKQVYIGGTYLITVADAKSAILRDEEE